MDKKWRYCVKMPFFKDEDEVNGAAAKLYKDQKYGLSLG